MELEVRKTKDGSNTLFVKELNEHYHSYNGALAESQHIFINCGFNHIEKREINILEVGFGTGLNAILTYTEAGIKSKTVFYCGIELNPLELETLHKLKYSELEAIDATNFDKIHKTNWEEEVSVSSNFTLQKKQASIIDVELKRKFDLVYFDAFAPEVQPDLWKESIFKKIFESMNINGVLLTYSSKGIVKRALRAAGFTVKRLAGPPGKRHILRATKVE